jgi:hypothetical protein
MEWEGVHFSPYTPAYTDHSRRMWKPLPVAFVGLPSALPNHSDTGRVSWIDKEVGLGTTEAMQTNPAETAAPRLWRATTQTDDTGALTSATAPNYTHSPRRTTEVACAAAAPPSGHNAIDSVRGFKIFPILVIAIVFGRHLPRHLHNQDRWAVEIRLPWWHVCPEDCPTFSPIDAPSFHILTTFLCAHNVCSLHPGKRCHPDFQ